MEHKQTRLLPEGLAQGGGDAYSNMLLSHVTSRKTLKMKDMKPESALQMLRSVLKKLQKQLNEYNQAPNDVGITLVCHVVW